MRLRALIAAVLIVAGVAAAVVVTVGRSDAGEVGPRACTLIGCGDLVTVDMDAAPYLRAQVAAIRLCVGTRCRTSSRISPLAGVPVPESARRRGASVSLRVSLVDRAGRDVRTERRTLKVTHTTPNGEGCGVCWSAGATLSREGSLVDHAPPLTASAHGIDVISFGRAIRAAAPRSALPLVPGGDVELRSRRPPGLVTVRYGDRVRRAWDSTREGGVTQILVGVPPGRRICHLESITVRSQLRGVVRRYRIPVRTRRIARAVGLHQTNKCGA